MADLDSRHSEMITQLLRRVTSLPHDANVKGHIVRRITYRPSLVVIALIFSELRKGRGGAQNPPLPFRNSEDEKKPGLNRIKPIRFARFDKFVNRGLPMLEPARGPDPLVLTKRIVGS